MLRTAPVRIRIAMAVTMVAGLVSVAGLRAEPAAAPREIEPLRIEHPPAIDGRLDERLKVLAQPQLLIILRRVDRLDVPVPPPDPSPAVPGA